jgi:hypothetical protein
VVVAGALVLVLAVHGSWHWWPCDRAAAALMTPLR